MGTSRPHPLRTQDWGRANRSYPEASDKVDVSLWLVTQICNLLYRRFPIGTAPEPTGALQVKNLRYSRLKICATATGG